MIRSHWEIISKILFSESLSYGSMDLEKILEYFIRFESLPAKGNARIRPQNVDLSEFFFAPTSRSLIQDISPPRSVVQVVCKFRGGEKLALASGKVSPFGRVCFRPRPPFHPPSVSYSNSPFSSLSSSYFSPIFPVSRSITPRYYTIAVTP